MKQTMEATETRTGVWKIDPAHSSAQFKVRHMMISNVKGEFSKVAGQVRFEGDDISKTSVEATVDVSTINTREHDRDRHLKSPDFFDVEKFPRMTFKSRRVEKGSNGNLKLIGDLSLHGVTREVTFEVEGPTPPTKDPWGKMRMGASATAKLNRKDFGLTWNTTLETGGVLVGDEVAITLDVELIAQDASGEEEK